MMISYFHCLLFFLFVVCCSTLRADGKRKIHWVFVWYHKTGHDLSHVLSNRQFEANPHCSHVRVPGKNEMTNNMDKDMIVPMAKNFTWHLLKSVNQSDDFRVLHFVRDPFDMVMSGYLYHKQVPQPAGERWLGSGKFDPCFNELNFKVGFYPTMTKYNITTTDLVNKTVSLCNQLKKKYWRGNYGDTLNMATDTFDAIRLEATRALLSNESILSMAYDCLLQKTTPLVNVVTRRTYTSEFPVQDTEMYKRSLVKVFDFLMPPKTNGEFYDCLGAKDKAVDQALIYLFERLPSTLTANSTVFSNATKVGVETDKREHITSTQMSKGDRDMYMKRLEKDEILGPLLSIARQIVYDN